MKMRKILPAFMIAALVALIPASVSAVDTKTTDGITVLNIMPESMEEYEDEYLIPDENNEVSFENGVLTVKRLTGDYSPISIDFITAGYDVAFDLTKDLFFEFDFEVTGSANMQIQTIEQMDIKFSVSDPKEGEVRPFDYVRFGTTKNDVGDTPTGTYSGSVNLKDFADKLAPDGDFYINSFQIWTIGENSTVNIKKLQFKGTYIGDKINEASTPANTDKPDESAEPTNEATPTQEPTQTVAPTTSKPTPTKAPATATSTTDGNDSSDGGIQTWVIVVIIVAVLAIAGGLVYYFMLVKKKNK